MSVTRGQGDAGPTVMFPAARHNRPFGLVDVVMCTWTTFSGRLPDRAAVGDLLIAIPSPQTHRPERNHTATFSYESQKLSIQQTSSKSPFHNFLRCPVVTTHQNEKRSKHTGPIALGLPLRILIRPRSRGQGQGPKNRACQKWKRTPKLKTAVEILKSEITL